MPGKDTSNKQPNYKTKSLKQQYQLPEPKPNKHQKEIDQFADQAILDELLQLDQQKNIEQEQNFQSGGRNSQVKNLDIKEAMLVSRSSPTFSLANDKKSRKKVDYQELMTIKLRSNHHLESEDSDASILAYNQVGDEDDIGYRGGTQGNISKTPRVITSIKPQYFG